jgi:uncharacterized protein YggE
MQKANTTPIAITAIVVIGVLIALFYIVPRQATENVVEVSGTAQMTVPPDRVVVYVQVETKAVTAEEAKNKNAETTSAVLSALAAVGIEKGDIETENYNIYQDCEWTQTGQKCKGFIANNNIKVTSKDFANVGKVVDAAVNAGGLVSYINFELSLEKQNEYKKEVLMKAAEDAKGKAEAIASGFGKRVGDLVSVSSSDFGYYPYPIFAKAEGAADARQVATELPSRNLDISASITARYEIR